MIAVSGIDSTVKIFSPDARARADAAAARCGVRAIDPSNFSSVRAHRQAWTVVMPGGGGGTDDEPEDTDEEAVAEAQGGGQASGQAQHEHEYGALMGSAEGLRAATVAARGGEDDDDDKEVMAPNGLMSRKRLHDEYRITVRNDMNRRAGKQMHLSRDMLDTIVGRLGDVMAENLDPEDAENCCIM